VVSGDLNAGGCTALRGTWGGRLRLRGGPRALRFIPSRLFREFGQRRVR